MGLNDGCDEGLIEGLSVGRPDGCAEGIIDGKKVGCIVGFLAG